MVVVDGYIGSDPAFRTRARLIIEAANANVAGMQQQLYYPVGATTTRRPGSPTPRSSTRLTCAAPGYPNDRVIAVDLKSNITRVLNSDYFGESKKGGLRMWNNIVYDRGGLALHAGCKVMPDRRAAAGAAHRRPVRHRQDHDHLHHPARQQAGPGRLHRAHARRPGLHDRERLLRQDLRARPQVRARHLQRDHQAGRLPGERLGRRRGTVDFFDTSYTKNGRTTWPFSYVDPWPANDIPPAEFLLILNRNENIVPGVARLDRAQAAAYFMLGETTGTSAGGKDEEGKFLRVPGTNPFFPRDMADMGNRMLELLESHELKVFVLNTGRVGGGDEHEGSKKVTIPYSSAIVQAIVEDTITWTSDPDFGYEVAESLPGVDDPEILQPRRLYERQGRMDEYAAMVARLKRERREYLSSFAGLTRPSSSRSASCPGPTGPAPPAPRPGRASGCGGLPLPGHGRRRGACCHHPDPSGEILGYGAQGR